jgi:hypothetical protein
VWPFLVIKTRCLGYALSYSVGYKAMVPKGFLKERRKGCVRRYAVRGVDGTGGGHSLVVGLHDVRAGATLALKA